MNGIQLETNPGSEQVTNANGTQQQHQEKDSSLFASPNSISTLNGDSNITTPTTPTATIAQASNSVAAELVYDPLLNPLHKDTDSSPEDYSASYDSPKRFVRSKSLRLDHSSNSNHDSAAPSPTAAQPLNSSVSETHQPTQSTLGSPSHSHHSSISSSLQISSTSSLAAWWNTKAAGASREFSSLMNIPTLFPDYSAEMISWNHALQNFIAQKPQYANHSLVPASLSNASKDSAAPAAKESSITSYLASPFADAATAELAAANRRFLDFHKGEPRRKVWRLLRVSEAFEGFLLEVITSAQKSLKKRETAADGLQEHMNRLRANMQLNEMNIIQECVHLQQLLYDNYDAACRLSMIVAKEKIAELKAVMDELSTVDSSSNLPQTSMRYQLLTPFDFMSPRRLALVNPLLESVMQTRNELEERVHMCFVQYDMFVKESERENLVPRAERFSKIMKDFIDFYNGDLTADYTPSRSIELEFAKMCLDERQKEGQILKKWFVLINQLADEKKGQKNVSDTMTSPSNSSASVASGVKLTHTAILHFLQRLELTLATEFKVKTDNRLYLRVLIQRMIFPRISHIIDLIESFTDSKEKEEEYTVQQEWMRYCEMDQLGIPDVFLMPATMVTQISRAVRNSDDAMISKVNSTSALPSKLRELFGARQHSVLSETLDDEDETDEFDLLFSSTLRVTDSAASSPAGATSASDVSPPTSEHMNGSNSSASLFDADENSVSSTSAVGSTVLSISTGSSSSSSSASPLTSSSTSLLSPSSHQSVASAYSTPLQPTTVSSVRPRLRPYGTCVECLEDMSQLQAPLDMLQCLLAVARTIYKTAREYSIINSGKSKSSDLGADAFFPIWLYILIQAEVPNLYRRMNLMQIYGIAGKTSGGELGEHLYYLTCLEGGIMHILGADPDRL